MKTSFVFISLFLNLKFCAMAQVFKEPNLPKRSRQGRVFGLLSLLAEIGQSLYIDADLFSGEDDREVSVKTKFQIQPYENYLNPYNRWSFPPPSYIYHQPNGPSQNPFFYPTPGYYSWIPASYQNGHGFNFQHSNSPPTEIIKNKWQEIQQEHQIVNLEKPRLVTPKPEELNVPFSDQKDDFSTERFTRQVEPIENEDGVTLDFRGDEDDQKDKKHVTDVDKTKDINKKEKDKKEALNVDQEVKDNETTLTEDNTKEEDVEEISQLPITSTEKPDQEILTNEITNQVELLQSSTSATTGSSFEIGQEAEFLETTTKTSSYYRKTPYKDFDPEKITFTTWFPQTLTELPNKEYGIFKPSLELKEEQSVFKPIAGPVASSTYQPPLLPPLLPYYH